MTQATSVKVPSCSPNSNDAHSCIHETGVIYGKNSISTCVKRIFKEASDIMTKWVPDCLVSITLEMAATVNDAPSNKTSNFSFIDTVDNLFPSIKSRFATHNCQFIESGRVYIAPEAWELLLNEMVDLSNMLIVLIYLTCGSPPRGTELVPVTFRNVDIHNTRDLVFENGHFVCIPTWNKTNNIFGN